MVPGALAPPAGPFEHSTGQLNAESCGSNIQEAGCRCAAQPAGAALSTPALSPCSKCTPCAEPPAADGFWDECRRLEVPGQVEVSAASSLQQRSSSSNTMLQMLQDGAMLAAGQPTLPQPGDGFAGSWHNNSLAALQAVHSAMGQDGWQQQGSTMQQVQHSPDSAWWAHAAYPGTAAAASPAGPASALSQQQLAHYAAADWVCADVGFVSPHGQEFAGCLPELHAWEEDGPEVPSIMQPYIAALEASAAARAAAAELQRSRS